MIKIQIMWVRLMLVRQFNHVRSHVNDFLDFSPIVAKCQ